MQSVRGLNQTMMNKQRRLLLIGVIQVLQKLKGTQNNPETLKALKQAAKDLEQANDEEGFAYDNLPDNLAWSMRADIMSDNLEDLGDAVYDMGVIVEAYESERDNPYKTVKKEIRSVIKGLTETIERI